MRIILVRHAPSMGNKDSKNYALYGDSKVPLDPEFSDKSIACGRFLKSYYHDTKTTNAPLIWTSQFLRAQQTYTGILQGLGDTFKDDPPRWHIDPRLNEQSFGILPYAANNDHRNGIPKDFLQASQYYSEKMYSNDAFNNAPLMGDSPREALQSVQNFLDGSFQRDINEGTDDIVIVSHGAVMKAFIMNWFHLYGLDTWKDIQTPGNCDVYVIEGEAKNWAVSKIYDGMKEQDLRSIPINPIAGIKRPNESPPPPLP